MSPLSTFPAFAVSTHKMSLCLSLNSVDSSGAVV